MVYGVRLGFMGNLMSILDSASKHVILMDNSMPHSDPIDPKVTVRGAESNGLWGRL